MLSINSSNEQENIMQITISAKDFTETAYAKFINSIKAWLAGFQTPARETIVKIIESSSETDVKRFEGLL